MHDRHSESSAQTSVGNLYVRTYREGVHMPRHSHSQARFSFVLEGCFFEKIGKLERDTDAAAVHFHPVDEEHVTRFLAPATRTLKVELNDRALSLLAQADLKPGQTASLQGSRALTLARRLTSLVTDLDPFKALTVESLTYELLAELGHARKAELDPASAKLLRARDLLSQTLPGKGAVEAAANEVGMHPFSFIRSFGAKFGVSPGEYLRQARLSRAIALLGEVDLTLAEVALVCGYSDQSHMTRAVKAASGKSPAAYRASCVQKGLDRFKT
jgi:AraC family transcriptional regulator